MLCLVFFKAEIIEIYKMLNTIVRQGLKRKLKVSGIFTKGLIFFFYETLPFVKSKARKPPLLQVTTLMNKVKKSWVFTG